MKHGFTLVELLITLALLSVLIVVMAQIFVSILDARTENEATASVEQDGSYILARLKYDVDRSNGISLPANAGAQGSTLRVSIGGVNYTYVLNSTNLELTTSSGTDRINSLNTTVSNLVFKRVGAGDEKDTIQVSFTLTSQIVKKGGPESKSFQTTLSSRQ